MILSRTGPRRHNSVALYGLGGIGKTQIAAEYAHRHQAQYSSVFWVDGSTRQKLVSDYGGIASKVLNVNGLDENPEGIATKLKLWFESEDTRYEDWLLIVDAADEIKEIQEFLPRAGNLLVTTRDQLVGGSVVCHGIEIREMNIDEATELLLTGVGVEEEEWNPETKGFAWAITKELGFLPLAIEQSASYIRETRCSLASYLEILKGSRTLMLNRTSKHRQSFSYEYKKTVATTWTVSFQRVAQETPIAAKLLYLFAFLDPESIPEETLIDGLKGLSECPELQEVAEDRIKFNDAIMALNSFSLVTRRSGERSIQLHVLLSHVIQEWVHAEGNGPRWVSYAISVLTHAFPSTSSVGLDIDRVRRKLVPHVLVCLQHAKHFPLSERARELFIKAGRFLLNTGVYDGAENCFAAVIADLEATVGRKCTSMAELLVFLCIASRRAGRWDEALALGKEALDIYEAVLGADHLNSVEALHHLGHAFAYKGQLQKAQPLYERALRIIERHDVKTHDERPWLMISMGIALCGEGNWQESYSMLTCALSFDKMQQDPYYASIALRAMGRFYYYRGQWTKSRQSFEDALDKRQKSLGMDHPDTAGYYCNVGAVLVHEGEVVKATEYFKRALKLQEDALRSEHFGIAYHLSGLGAILAKERRLAEAEARYARALTVRGQGSNPTEMAWTVNSLAAIFAKQGNSKAETLFKEALEIRKNNLGIEHDETQRTIRQLVAYYQFQGCYDEAMKLSTMLTSAGKEENESGRVWIFDKLRMCQVYRAEAYLDDGIHSFYEAGNCFGV